MQILHFVQDDEDTGSRRGGRDDNEIAALHSQ